MTLRDAEKVAKRIADDWFSRPEVLEIIDELCKDFNGHKELSAEDLNKIEKRIAKTVMDRLWK